MGALTILGVDPATDQLHITAHGLNTGDGFLAIFTPTPTGAIPAGLAGVTYYWAIRVDADHVKLASSSANALANVAIDITNAGGGSLFLLQGLPFCIPRIAAPGVEIFSGDDNSAWQGIVALWNLLSGQAQTVFSRVKFAVPVAPNHGNIVKPFAIDTGKLVINTGGAGFSRAAGTPGGTLGAGGDAWFELPELVTTDRLQQVVVWAHDGNATSTMRIYVFDESGAAAVVASASVGMAAGGLAPITMAITAPSVAAGRMYMLRVQAGTDVVMSKGEITYDAPDS